MDGNEKIVKKILMMVGNTNEQESDCSHVYELMDEVVELQAAGIDLSNAIPQIQHHLDMCQCCQAEYTALRRILESDIE